MLSNSVSQEHYRVAQLRRWEDLSTAATRRQQALLPRQPAALNQLRNLLGMTLIAVGQRMTPAPGQSAQAHRAISS